MKLFSKQDATTARVPARPVKPAHSAGFTLLEMLVVMVIISILIGMIASAYVQARNHARRGRAETQLREIVKAWTDYYVMYTNWPAAVDGAIDVPMSYNAATGNGTLKPLFADDTVNNPRGIPFLSISPSDLHTYSSGQVCYTDPWWTPRAIYPANAYKITFKTGHDNSEAAMRISVSFPNRDRYR